ncbi:hypothetical protein ASE04_29625, partial [Rhizobium sp. Root708]
KAWVTDITYIRTVEGFAYLAVVIDLYSRRVIGCNRCAAPTGRDLLRFSVEDDGSKALRLPVVAWRNLYRDASRSAD